MRTYIISDSTDVANFSLLNSEHDATGARASGLSILRVMFRAIKRREQNRFRSRAEYRRDRYNDDRIKRYELDALNRFIGGINVGGHSHD